MPSISSSGEEFRSLVRERAPGIPYPLIYPVLRCASWLYGGAVALRNILYDHSLLKSRRAGVRVVSVGNITVGGTGKTPIVHRLAAEAVKRGFRPGVVSRGYGTRPEKDQSNDEGLLLERELPGVPVVQDPERSRAALRCAGQHGADLIIMDDGFQHRRLHRDFDLLVIDASRPFGFHRLLPAGLLREPLASLRRAHAMVITRCDQVSAPRLEEIGRIVDQHAPQALRIRSIHAPKRLQRIGDDRTWDPAQLKGSKVFALSAVARPEAFERTLFSLGAEVRGWRAFPDHHWFTEEEVRSVRRLAEDAGADRIVVTAKDAVKLERIEAGRGLYVLDVEIRFLEDPSPLWDLLFSR